MQLDLKEIEDGLNDGEFFIEYQPIMQIDGKKCLGAEALIRWNRFKTIVPPMDFIPFIENTPMSGLLTYWLIENVNQELGQWLQNQDNAFLSINIPPELLGRGGLAYAATKSGLMEYSEKIMIEITERGIPDNLGLQGLLGAKKRGFQICLDDVGASNENLLIYSRTEIDVIKLDKSIADEMLEPDWTVDKVGSLGVFAKSTKINIIAEGIETEIQKHHFQQMGVSMGQGWFYSHALAAKDFIKYFNSINKI